MTGSTTVEEITADVDIAHELEMLTAKTKEKIVIRRVVFFGVGGQ